MDNKSVTIIVPAYNRGEQLKWALSSLVTQTNKDFCVIVADDASTEDLKSICDDFKKVLDLTYFKNMSNLGCGGNRRQAVKYFYAHPTKYLMFLDSDDSFYPQTIDHLLKAIEANGSDLVTSYIVSDEGRPDPAILDHTIHSTWLHGKIYRTDFLKEHNINFPATLSTNEDLVWNLSVYGLTQNITHLTEPLYLFRRIGESETRNLDKPAARKCFSVDYVEAQYWAWKGGASKHQIAINIIEVYRYFECGKILNTLEQKHYDYISELLHIPEVMIYIIGMGKAHPEPRCVQWMQYKEDLKFFDESFGTWLSKFYTQEDLQQALKLYNESLQDE